MLTVNEIFYSIQGESTRAGRPCVFVRLTACDLRCSWCDTPYAFHEGRKRSVEEIVAEVERYDCTLVEITGGEPLLQAEVYPLMERLLANGRTVMLETGGHRPIAQVPRAVVKIFLEAPEAVRKARRAAQLRAGGARVDPAVLEAEVAGRDRIDSSRAAAPMQPAPDAHVIDNDGSYGIDDVVQRALALCRKAGMVPA